MKPVAPLLLLACLCACSRPAPDSLDAPTRTASAKTPGASTPASQPPATAATVGEPAPGAAAPAAAGLPRLDGYGALRLGMGIEEARKAWAGELVGDEVRPDNCAYLRPKWAKTGSEFGLMFEGGRFVRYDVGTDREAAPGGGRVGMGLQELRKLYAGRLTEAPHHYVEGGKDVRLGDPASKERAIVFEVDPDGRVTRWHAGLVPQVDYVEGCS